MRRLIPGVVLLLLGVALGYQISGNVTSMNQHATEAAVRADDSQLEEIRLQCLTDQTISSIKKTGLIEAAQNECLKELKQRFGSEFNEVSEEGWRAIFATAVAANFAEYGGSSASTYEQIAKSTFLNCGQTVLLTGYLFGPKNTSLRSIGFDGGAVGNHAQNYYVGKVNMLLDPTTGLVALTSFDDLLRGIPVPSAKIRMLTIKAQTIGSFRKKVFTAVKTGAYRPSDFMYMHTSLDEHKSKGSSENYFSPGGIYVREVLSKANKTKIILEAK